jgi:hypothetical protein
MTKNSAISIVSVFLICGCGGIAENKSLDADKAIWQRHRELAKARAYNWLPRSHYNTTPWFVEGESMVHENGKLVALRYHMAAVGGRGQHDHLKQLETQRQATHIIQYSLVKHEWTLVHPDSAKAKPYRERLGGDLDRTQLSEKARGFVTSVRDDGSSFLLYVFRGGPGPPRRIVLYIGKRPGLPQPVEISRSEAIRIVDYLAGQGLLDKNDGMPCGKIVGWYLTLFTGGDHHIASFFGMGKQALLGRSDVLGVRGVLGSKTAKKWDAFVDQVRAEIADK